MATIRLFSCGETVKLNSGGPLMTVSEILDRGMKVKCAWFGLCADGPYASIFSSEQIRDAKAQEEKPAKAKK